MSEHSGDCKNRMDGEGMGGQWATSHWFKDSRVPATGSDSGAPATGSTTAGRQPLVQRQHGTSHWFKDSRASATGSDSGAPASGSKAVGHLPLVQRQQAQATGLKTAGHYWFKDIWALLLQRQWSNTGSKTVRHQPLVQRQLGTSHWFKDSGNQPLTGSKTKTCLLYRT